MFNNQRYATSGINSELPNSADNALEQIKQKNYTEKLNAFSGEILLVGISYDDSKGHTCKIEKIAK
ncbi:MAG: hypothetical protein J6C38_01620 [Oscillospiraceae bacterium]|nr:hypothetical protein [Oscillospiraceae bacterium]